MKKYILIILVMFLVLPSVVCSKEIEKPPVFITYNVKVNNTNGITLTTNSLNKEQINIPNDTVLEVLYEYEEKGKLYGNVEYNNYSGMIEIKDVELLDEEVNSSNYKSDETKKIYIFDEEAVLYKGPSKAYGIKDNIKIPVGTVLTYNIGDSAWGYVTYNGVKGWIYVYTYNDIIYEKGAKVALVCDNKYLYTLKEIELISSPLTNNKLDIKIPEMTKVEYKYTYSIDPYTTYYYIKYKDKEGWYKEKKLEVASFYDDNFIVNAIEDSNIYEKPSVESKVLNSIKKDDEYTVLAISINDDIESNTYESWSYVNYRNTKGFLYHYEKGKEEVKKEDKNDNNVETKDTKKSKSNSSLTILAFSISIVIILLFVIYTIVRTNKKDNNN